KYSVVYVFEFPQELLTTSGALSGSPPGAMNHSNASWIPDTVALPLSLKTLAAIHSAPGATPIGSPSPPPTADPATCVPCPCPSVGTSYPSLEKSAHDDSPSPFRPR